MDQIEKIHPKGYIVTRGMFYGFLFAIGIGLTLSYLFSNNTITPISLPVGLIIGGLIGRKIENRLFKAGRIKPMSKEEMKIERFFIAFALILFIISLLIFFMILP